MQLSIGEIVSVVALFTLIFILIFLLAVATPKLAKFCDKLIGKLIRNKNSAQDNSIYKVKSIYDKPSESISEENNNSDGENDNGKE